MSEKFTCSSNTVCSRSSWKHSARCIAKLSEYFYMYIEYKYPYKCVYSYKPPHLARADVKSNLSLQSTMLNF